jgi:hypothetical protein
VIAAAVLVLALLVLSQVALARRSRRRLNPGLALASVLMAVLVVWLTVAGLVSTHAATNARMHGGEPLDAAVSARIFAQQARADEILGLLKRGSDALSDIRFDERTAQTGWLLDKHRVDGAADSTNTAAPWRSREMTGRNIPRRSSPGWTRHYGTTSRDCATGSAPGSPRPTPR